MVVHKRVSALFLEIQKEREKKKKLDLMPVVSLKFYRTNRQTRKRVNEKRIKHELLTWCMTGIMSNYN